MRLRNTHQEVDTNRIITFGHIDAGEIFMFEDDLYMKLGDEVEIVGEDNDEEYSEHYNAVFLSDGELTCFANIEAVQRFAVTPELIYDSDKTMQFFPKM